MTGLAIGAAESKCVVSEQPVGGALGQLNGPTAVHAIEHVVYNSYIAGVAINSVVESQVGLSIGAANVMENIAVENKIVFPAVQVNPITAVLIGHSMVRDISDLVPADGDVVGVVVALDSRIAGPLNDKPFED